MKILIKAIISVCIALCFSSACFAQYETPRVELFGGYSFARQGQVNFNGWTGSFAGSFNKWVGIVADGSAHYATTSENFASGDDFKAPLAGRVSIYSYRFGPKFAFRSSSRITPFAQALAGGVRTSAHLGYLYEVHNGPAAAVGGGIDIAVSNNISIRAAQADFSLFRIVGSDGRDAQSRGVRLSFGTVIRF